ncbi:MAG: serine/threonine protein kinase [Pirellulales bacterium]
MREEPPQPLVDLLGRLHLAAADQVRGMDRHLRRLARELPLFESVWVDALAQAGVITPFQSAEINAGRGEALKVGPYVLCRPLSSTAFGVAYHARQIDSGRTVRLVVLRTTGPAADDLEGRLDSLAAMSAQLEAENVAPVERAGLEGDRAWAASRAVPGQTAGEWMVRNGRFPPGVVLEIARQMLVGLTRLESAGMIDGDVGADRLILTASGNVVMPLSGLRGILRPAEGYSHADLQPEAYDYLAPERISNGTPPRTASDIYACGCLWWHLLTGRPPLAGGNSLAKLRAAHAAKIMDVRRLAPATPAFLAAAISACTQPAVERRPASMAELAAMLGPPTREGRAMVARSLVGRGRWVVRGFDAIHALGSLALPKDGLGGSLALPKCLAFSERFSGGQVHRARWWLLAGVVVLAAVTSPAWFSRLPFGALRLAAPSAEDLSRQREASLEKASGPSAKGPDTAVEALSPKPRETLPPNPEVPAAESRVVDLILPADAKTDITTLKLQPGQRVRGAAGGRSTIRLPRGGWVVACENVRFENIDFVASDSPLPTGARETVSAMIVLEACHAAFHGCSFQGASPRAGQSAAIVWAQPAGRRDSELSLPTGQLDLTGCTLRGVAAGVDCRAAGALFLKFENTLHLGPGPLVRLARAPPADGPVTLLLRRFTLRDATSLVECLFDRIEDSPGKIAFQASDSAFVPDRDGCLLALVGKEEPDRLVRCIEWTGQGSVVSPDAALARWRRADGQFRTLDEQLLAVAGLVRSEVTFAGRADGRSGQSRIVRWQAPLRSPDPPGIDETLDTPSGAADHGGSADRARQN